MHSDMWTLLVAEKDYVRLVTCVTERAFDNPTMAWITSTIEGWPNSKILSGPRVLQEYMWHLLSSVNIDTHVAMLNAAAEMNTKLEMLQAQKKKLAVRMIAKIQRGIKQLEKMNAKKKKRKLKNGRR